MINFYKNTKNLAGLHQPAWGDAALLSRAARIYTKNIAKYKFTSKVTTRSMSTLYTQKLTKIPVKNLVAHATNKLVPIKKHSATVTQEWKNGVYSYNSETTILLSSIDKIVIKLLKSYFNGVGIYS